MNPAIFQTAALAAEAVAARIVAQVRASPRTVLGLATGATMEPVYRALIAAHRAGRVSFAEVSTFNLDEYVGLGPDHPGSYRATMRRLFFDHVDIDPARTHVPESSGASIETVAHAYEAAIARAGGIDLQILGIGRNGHIGFNEPGSERLSRTRLVELDEDTRDANRAFFETGEVPRQAVTMGIGTILGARRIAILATGSAKREAVARARRGGFDPACPASALGDHGDTSWYLDVAAMPGAVRACETTGAASS